VLLVELRTRGQRPSELDENVRQESVVQMHHCLAPILPRAHQSDGDAVVIGVGVELRVPAKAADVGFVGKIDGNLSLVADRGAMTCLNLPG
jgi:hypothetical protein